MITLVQSRVGRADKIEQKIIDTFIRESEVLELLPFDDAVSPNGGSTLIYGYVQQKSPSSASFRAIGTEYTNDEATVEPKTVTLAIFGGAFKIDRVIKTIEGQLNNMAFQLEEKIRAAVGLFHDAIINGDVAQTTFENGFDGLDKMLVGTRNEMNIDEYIDLSTMESLKENASIFYEKLTTLINSSNADAILVNQGMKTKIQTVARVLGYQTASEEAFGRLITSIDNIRMIDLKNRYTKNGTGDAATATETPIIGANISRTLNTQNISGLTDIYAIKFDVNDGFHGVTVVGDKVIDTFLPDFNTPGAVKTGEVEMVACVALKNANNAGVLRNIKIG